MTGTVGKAATSKDRKLIENFERCLKSYGSDDLHQSSWSPRTIRDFAAMLGDDLLNLAPNYQRGYVWEPYKASRLVMTVLGDRFVHGIVLHEVEKGKYDVVDGKQRFKFLPCR
jgi:uncharacterized protein with ParB-like and HNH nuclease domain